MDVWLHHVINLLIEIAILLTLSLEFGDCAVFGPQFEVSRDRRLLLVLMLQLVLWIVELEQVSHMGKIETLLAFFDITQDGPLDGHFLLLLLGILCTRLLMLEVQSGVKLNQVTPKCLQGLWRVNLTFLLRSCIIILGSHI